MRNLDGLPIVAVVGRPNVGKSTLFNRLIRRREAVVHDEAGITRDRNYARTDWEGRDFWLVDTGGMTLWKGKGIELEIQEQVGAAIEESDVVLLLLDAGVGLTADDETVVKQLLARKKRVVVAANKADDETRELEVHSFSTRGLGAVLPIAAQGGRGIGELLDEIVRALPPADESAADEEEEDDVVRVAVIGRPNVGKSSLVNAIVGEKTVIVDETPGTTRDSVDTPVVVDDQKVLLVDTAGLRRKGKWGRGVEYWSALRTMRSLDRCDVAVVVVDATTPITEQDVTIAAEADNAFKSVILVANKWDAVEKDPLVAARFEDRVSWHFKFLTEAPILYVSAVTGRRVGKILPEVLQLSRVRRRRIPTAKVNELLQRIVTEHPPPSARSRRITRIFYGTQVSTRPPTFAIFTNRPENLEGHYQRFLRNRLRSEFRFRGVPVRVVLRKREEKKST